MKLLIVSILIVLMAAGCTPKPNDKLNMAAYESLSLGMTVDEVVKTIGAGEKLVEGQGVTIFQYYGKGSTGANAHFTFQDDKLVMKAQTGLR